MTPDTLQWLPVVLGSSALTLGTAGLLLALLPSLQKRQESILQGSALYLLTGVLFILPAFDSALQLIDPPPTVTLSLTSDPSGADVYSGEKFLGTTPLELRLAQNTSFTYHVRAGDSVPDKSLYKPFEGSVIIEEDVAVSVWLDRRK